MPCLKHLADRSGGDRKLAVAPVGADDHSHLVSLAEVERFHEIADPELRPLQVADQRERPTGLLFGIPDELGPGRVVVVGSVREVEAGRVHSRLDEPVDQLGGRRGRTDRGNDLRSPRCH